MNTTLYHLYTENNHIQAKNKKQKQKQKKKKKSNDNNDTKQILPFQNGGQMTDFRFASF